MNLLAVLGRQPEFGLAELESLLGADAITPLPNGLALLTNVSEVPYARFGSIIKFAQVHDGTANTSQLTEEISSLVAKIHPYEEGVKLKIGISDYSGQLSSASVNKLGLSVKKVLKKDGYSVRIIPNSAAKLGSAHIIHNKLTSSSGTECLIVKTNIGLQLATTVYEQDIEGYAARDQARPMRDARVGMLPPKLAQTIINLATGTVDSSEIQNKTVLDPFCGTGVILQEAALMGFKVYGADLEERMVRYSRDNLLWLKDTHRVNFDWYLEVGDASSKKWRHPIDYIAAETYLGKPLTTLPSKNDLMDLVQNVNTLHKKALQNMHSQITQNTRICLAVPAWKTREGFIHLPVLDQLDKMGYNQLVFSHVNAKNLVYARADQIVARQLVVLQKQ